MTRAWVLAGCAVVVLLGMIAFGAMLLTYTPEGPALPEEVRPTPQYAE